ncbi:hypothetical protein TELCIR_25956, partial [Teladorsagia circumcincta]
LMAPPESVLRAGPMMNVPRETLSSITISQHTAAQPKKMKRNKTELEEPTQETFKELSGLLQ